MKTLKKYADFFVIVLLGLMLVAIVGLAEFQDSVILRQKQLIEQMVTNPACTLQPKALHAAKPFPVVLI